MTSDWLVVTLLIGVLLLGTVPIAHKLAHEEGDSRLFWLLMASTALRFGCTFLQVFVTKHAYGGVADFNGYEHRGAALAASWRHGDFTTGSAGIHGNGTVDVVTAAVFMLIGDDQAGAFIVFSWLALLGLLAFYRAFRIALPSTSYLRYAVLLFLMPSLLFWSSDVGKEALMTLFLGVATHGAARLLRSQTGALIRLVFGLALATLLRPNEAILLFVAIAIGFLLSRTAQQSRYGPLSVLGWLVLFAAGGFTLLVATEHFLHIHSLSPTAVTASLRKTDVNNAGAGAGFGSSNYHYSSSLLHYPKDVYTVLFDPLPMQAHSLTQLLASLENLVVLGILLTSLGRLWTMVRTVLRQPFVALCLVYTLLFLYFFASLGNLGLLDRERSLLFPYLLVLVSLPHAGRRRRHVPPWTALEPSEMVPATR